MRLIFTCLIYTVFTSNAKGQFFSFYAEPMVGFHFYKSIRTAYEPNKIKGVTNLVGLKTSIGFGDYGSLNFTRGINSIQYPELFGQITARVHVYRPKKYLTLFVEAGAHISEFDYFQTPVYLGIINNEGNVFSWVTRIRIPTGLDTHVFKTISEYHFGIEVGLQINLLPNRKPPPLQRFGNPFILG